MQRLKTVISSAILCQSLCSKNDDILVVCELFPFWEVAAVAIFAVWISAFYKVAEIIAHLAGNIIIFSCERTPAFCKGFKPEPQIYGMEFSWIVPARNVNVKLIAVSFFF